MSENVRFSANQLKFIDWLAAGKYDRSPPTRAEFAASINVADRTLYRWQRGQNGFTEAEFWDAVAARARELTRQALANVYNSLREQAEMGSFQHTKLLLELAGEYQEKQELSGEIKINVVYDRIDADATETA